MSYYAYSCISSNNASVGYNNYPFITQIDIFIKYRFSTRYYFCDCFPFTNFSFWVFAKATHKVFM